MNRKTIITFLVFIAFATTAGAQMNRNALGARVGGAGTINRAEISYQLATGTGNRLEFDLGFGTKSYHDQVYLATIFQWNHNIIGSLNWYAGPGAAFGIKGSDTGIYFGGQLGVELNLRKTGLPFLVSLDIRPMWSIPHWHEAFDWTGALGLRYVW